MINARQFAINASAHHLPLPGSLFHCVVTSPPYWSLRQYAGEQRTHWPAVSYSPMPGLPPLTVPEQDAALGLEPTPEAFIGHLVLVFREIARVMRGDGVAWCVMGDSYAGGAGGRGDSGRQFHAPGSSGGPASAKHNGERIQRPVDDLKTGDLLMIPHRLALALQADGWTVRNDAVWGKKSAMPESVSGWNWQRHRVKVGNSEQNGTPTATGRKNHNVPGAHASAGTPHTSAYWADCPGCPEGTPHTSAYWADCPGCPECAPNGGLVLRRGSWRHTRAHEYVLMLTRGMGYFANQEAVREAAVSGERFHGAYASGNRTQGDNGRDREDNETTTRNPRSVLTPAPESYSGAHYAVFPSSLIAPLMRATCPAKCCPVCGAPWAPVVERVNPDLPLSTMGRIEAHTLSGGYHGSRRVNVTAQYGKPGSADLPPRVVKNLGYRPTCAHDAEPAAGWVLDPFCGSGTTLMVARELMLNAVGVDISAEYIDQHVKPRALNQTPAAALADLPLFAGPNWNRR